MKRLIPGVEGANTAAWRFTNPASARRSDAALEPGSPPQLLDQAISTASAGFPGLCGSARRVHFRNWSAAAWSDC
jgi:hypothetical protein